MKEIRTQLVGIVLALISQGALAQSSLGFAGHYTGEMIREGQSLRISIDLRVPSPLKHKVVYFCPMHPKVVASVAGKCPICGMDLVPHSGENSVSGRFTSLTQQVMDYPLDAVTIDGDKVHFALGDSMVFDAKATPYHLDGSFKDGERAGTFHLVMTPLQVLPYAIRDVTFRHGDVLLSGSLLVPRSPGKHSGVVLLHGSGPQTRWGTLRFVADRFARAGVVALIYDKRGSGHSSGDISSFNYDELAGDALAGVRLLTSLPEVDRRRIGLMGHSEGGITAVVAASLAPHEIGFLVAEDTVAGPIYQQDSYRVSNALRQTGFKSEEIAQAMSVYADFVAVARGLKPYDELEADKKRFGGTEWFQWLGIPPRDAALWKTAPQRENLDTLVYWRKVNVPVLLIYGENDAIVPVDDSIQKIENALQGNASFTAVIAPRAQHNLSVQPSPGEQFFWWRSAPGVTDLAVSWAISGRELPLQN